MFDAPWHSRAIAVLTQESIPPLKSTTAFRESLIKSFINSEAAEFPLCSLRNLRVLCVFGLSFPFPFSCDTSNALGSRIPNKFVQLQPEPHGYSVSPNPFHTRTRLEAPPLPLRIFENRREQHLFYAPRQAMFQRKISCKFIVAPRRKHKLHFIIFRQRL